LVEISLMCVEQVSTSWGDDDSGNCWRCCQSGLCRRLHSWWPSWPFRYFFYLSLLLHIHRSQAVKNTIGSKGAHGCYQVVLLFFWPGIWWFGVLGIFVSGCFGQQGSLLIYTDFQQMITRRELG
jgi:hypothetical protein